MGKSFTRGAARRRDEERDVVGVQIPLGLLASLEEGMSRSLLILEVSKAVPGSQF